MNRRGMVGVLAAGVTLLLGWPPAKPASGSGAVSDFNGDGASDAAMWIRGETHSGHYRAGTLHVLYGTERGLTAQGDQVWHQDVPGVKGQAEDHGRFGWRSASGDLNCDGFDDLAIGSQEGYGGTSGGAVTVLFGSRRGLTARGDLHLRPGSLGGSKGASKLGSFSLGLAVGNFGRGPCADVAVGDPYATVESGGVTHGSAGTISLFYGRRSGLREQRRLIRQDTPGIGGDVSNFASFGWMLDAGNVSGSRFDELIVGNAEARIGDTSNGGSVHVLRGRKKGLGGGPMFVQEDFGAPGGTESDDQFGRELAVGNLGRGSYEDIVIATPGERFGDSAPSRGLVYLIYGGRATIAPSKFELLDMLDAGEPIFGFGAAVAVDNFRRGGARELAVGAPNTRAGGSVYVFPSSRQGIIRQPTELNLLTPGVRGEPWPGEPFGLTLGAGNFDASGPAELLVGGPFDHVGDQLDAGSVHALYFGRRHIGPRRDRVFHQDVRGVRGRAETGDQFGKSLIGGG